MPATLRPHSCRYCRRIAVVHGHSYNFLRLNLSYRQALRAAKLGCRFLQDRIRLLPTSYRSCKRYSLRLTGHVMPNDEDLGEIWFRWEGPGRNSVIEDELQVFALRRNPAGRHIVNRPLNPEPASKQNFAWMRRCLDNCRENHAKCREIWESHRSLALPCRFVDVGSAEAYLVYIRTTNQFEMERYAVPSYAWGTGQESGPIDAIKTRRENLQERMERGIHLSKLPQTIQDVVRVTREVGLRYLWVDALCIVQDDPDELGREFEKMEFIYKGSEVLISAAMAKHSDQGFLSVRDLNQMYGTVYRIPYKLNLNSEEQGSIFLCEGSLCNPAEPIHKRIWTHQEHELASRILSFGSRQVRWSCAEVLAVDGGSPDNTENRPAYLPREAFQGSLVWPDFLRHEVFPGWMKAVEEYSARHYTHQADRLAALAAYTRLFAAAIRKPVSECSEGVWIADAHRQLLWMKKEVQGPSERYAPSWSWASLPGAVTYSCELPWRDNTLNIQAFARQAARIIRLDVKGYIREARWNGRLVRELREEASFMSLFPRGVLPIKIVWDVEISAQSIWLLEVSSKFKISMSRGLVLVQNEEYLGTFERRGYFELDHLWFLVPNTPPEYQQIFLDLVPNWIQEGEYQRVSII